MPFTAYQKPEDIDPLYKSKVLRFIEGVIKNEVASWPSNYTGYLWKDGKELQIHGGIHWEMGRSEVYAANDPNIPTPPWAIEILSAIAQKFGFLEDPDISRGLLEMATKVAAGIFSPLVQPIMAAFNGEALTRLAINSETKALAGEFPAEPGSIPIWRLAVTGEEIDINSPGWTVFSI